MAKMTETRRALEVARLQFTVALDELRQGPYDRFTETLLLNGIARLDEVIEDWSKQTIMEDEPNDRRKTENSLPIR